MLPSGTTQGCSAIFLSVLLPLALATHTKKKKAIRSNHPPTSKEGFRKWMQNTEEQESSDGTLALGLCSKTRRRVTYVPALWRTRGLPSEELLACMHTKDTHMLLNSSFYTNNVKQLPMISFVCNPGYLAVAIEPPNGASKYTRPTSTAQASTTSAPPSQLHTKHENSCTSSKGDEGIGASKTSPLVQAQTPTTKIQSKHGQTSSPPDSAAQTKARTATGHSARFQR